MPWELNHLWKVISFSYCLVAVVDFVRHSRIWKFVYFPRNVTTHCAASHPLTLSVVSRDRKWYVRLFNCMANNQLCKAYAKHWCLKMILFEFPLLGLKWSSAVARARLAPGPHPTSYILIISGSLTTMTISKIVSSRWLLCYINQISLACGLSNSDAGLRGH